MGYWDATDEYLRRHGGKGPACGYCGEAMIPEDDHGRFTCFCPGYRGGMRPRITIPQLTEDLPDEIKKNIPPINRLNLPPTEEEKKVLDKIMEGMGKKTLTKSIK